MRADPRRSAGAPPPGPRITRPRCCYRLLQMAAVATARCQAACTGAATAASKRAAHLAAPRANPLRSVAAAQSSAVQRCLASVQAVAAPAAPAAPAAARPKAVVEQDKSLQKPTAIVTGQYLACMSSLLVSGATPKGPLAPTGIAPTHA